jgi:hypothetical protein
VLYHNHPKIDQSAGLIEYPWLFIHIDFDIVIIECQESPTESLFLEAYKRELACDLHDEVEFEMELMSLRLRYRLRIPFTVFSLLFIVIVVIVVFIILILILKA